MTPPPLNSRTVPWIALVAAAVLLAGALSWLQLHSGNADPAVYFENLALLRQIKQLDAQWELNAMKSRNGINSSYDPLVDPVLAMRTLPGQLRHSERAEQGADAELHASILAYQAALEEKISLVESFKSHNAVLRNSLAFLPQAAQDVVLDQPSAGKAAVDLLLATLIHQHGGAHSSAREIADQLGLLESRSQIGSNASQGHVAIFAVHLRTVLREHAVVDALLTKIVHTPTTERVDGINALLGSRHRLAVRQLQQFRGFLLVLSFVLAGLVLFGTMQLLQSYAAIRRAHQALRQANEGLELRVRDRTTALEETQRQLVVSARRAGMAEVATNVLHNVGNVLNSMSISAGLLMQQLRASRSAGLDKAVALLPLPGPALLEFLQHNPIGQNLPSYLQALAAAMRAERATMEVELANLSQCVEHVKDIVATQQSYAGASCLVELCNPATLIEEALTLSMATLAEFDVRVDTELIVVPAAMLDRHRVLQILVNLLTNAAQAMARTPATRRRIAVRLSAPNQATLQIDVSDHGVGIASDRLTKIFEHGYTTRETGHGFGLHSCALAAREMGGSLHAHSGGAGLGATFTLTLSVHAPIPACEESV